MWLVSPQIVIVRFIRTAFLRRVSSLAAKPAGIIIGGGGGGEGRSGSGSSLRLLAASSLSLSLSSLAHFCQLCFCHFSSVLDSRRWCFGRCQAQFD